jgi:hypothetical protein
MYFHLFLFFFLIQKYIGLYKIMLDNFEGINTNSRRIINLF